MDLPLTNTWQRYENDDAADLRATAKARDDEAFSEIVARQAHVLHRVAFAVVRGAQEAEDVVQETFLKLYRTGAWKHMQQERAFLARAVWRNALDRLPRVGLLVVDLPGTEIADKGDSPEQSSLRTAEHALLHKLIDGLPEETRQPLLLCAIEGMTSQEVAAILSIQEGTVRTRVMRAKAELRRRFERMRGVRR